MDWLAAAFQGVSAKDAAYLVIIVLQTRIIMVFATRFFDQQDRMMSRIMKVDDELPDGGNDGEK